MLKEVGIDEPKELFRRLKHVITVLIIIIAIILLSGQYSNKYYSSKIKDDTNSNKEIHVASVE